MNLKTVVIMGSFLNIGSKTNMAGHYAETSGNWVDDLFQATQRTRNMGKGSTQLKG